MSQVLTESWPGRSLRGEGWQATDYHIGRALLADPTCTARPPQAALHGRPGLENTRELLAAIWQQILFADGPTHRRLRLALDRPLAEQCARMLPFIRNTVAELLAAGQQQGDRKSVV